MKNFVQPGDTITVIAPSNVLADAVVIVGAIVGIAACDAPMGTPVEISTVGVFTLPKTVGGALAAGDVAKVSAGIVGSAGAIPIGWIVSDAASAANTVLVRLVPGIGGAAAVLAETAGATREHGKPTEHAKHVEHEHALKH